MLKDSGKILKFSLIFTVTSLVLLLLALKKIDDFDYWTHLYLGQYFAENLPKLPLTGLLFDQSYSGWPFQLLLHYVRMTGGDALVSLVIALMATAIFVPFYAFLAKDRTKTLICQLSLLMLVYSVCSYRFFPRPEVVAYLLFSLSLLLGVSWLDRPHPAKLAGMLLMLLIWLPLHVTVYIGAPFLGALLLCSDLTWGRVSKITGRAKYLLLGTGALLGVAVLVLAAKFAGFVITELQAGGVLFAVSEMRPTWEYPEVASRYLAVVAGCGWAVLQGRQTRRWHLPLMLLLAVLGVVVVRNVAIASLGMLCLGLTGLRGWTWPVAWSQWTGRVLVAVAALLVLGVGGDILLGRGQQWGGGVAEPYFPREASRFVIERGLPGTVYNNFDCGGYLLWAWQGKIRYFLDGRLGSREKMEDDDRIIAGENLAPLLAKYDIRTFLLQPFYWNSGRIFPLVTRLLFSPDWQLVYAGDALVFVDRLPEGLSALPKSAGWQAILDFSDAYAQVNPGAPHLPFSRGIALLGLGQRDVARETFLRGVRQQPDLADYYRSYLAY